MDIDNLKQFNETFRKNVLMECILNIMIENYVDEKTPEYSSKQIIEEINECIKMATINLKEILEEHEKEMNHENSNEK